MQSEYGKPAAVGTFVAAAVGVLTLPILGTGALLGPSALVLAWFGRRSGSYRPLAWIGAAIGILLVAVLVARLVLPVIL